MPLHKFISIKKKKKKVHDQSLLLQSKSLLLPWKLQKLSACHQTQIAVEKLQELQGSPPPIRVTRCFKTSPRHSLRALDIYNGKKNKFVATATATTLELPYNYINAS